MDRYRREVDAGHDAGERAFLALPDEQHVDRRLAQALGGHRPGVPDPRLQAPRAQHQQVGLVALDRMDQRLEGMAHHRLGHDRMVRPGEPLQPFPQPLLGLVADHLLAQARLGTQVLDQVAVDHVHGRHTGAGVLLEADRLADRLLAVRGKIDPHHHLPECPCHDVFLSSTKPSKASARWLGKSADDPA